MRRGNAMWRLAHGLVEAALVMASLVALAGPAAAYGGSWEQLGEGAAPVFSTTTLLPNNTVLETGGFNGSIQSAAYLYDPATDTWSPAGSMGDGRYAHTATLL